MYKSIIAFFLLLLFTTSTFAKENSSNADIDLTRMSSTMVYSMVYQMVTDPQKYVGKRIKMKGAFSSYFDEEANEKVEDGIGFPIIKDAKMFR